MGMYELLKALYPLCRSVTGDGNRKTLEIINRSIPLTIEEYASGTSCFDWVIPDEWNIRDAYIKDESGKKIVDFKVNNLHVLNYSEPVEGIFSWDELANHLYTDPEQPDAIPYRTSYYKRRWGFCLKYEQFKKLKRTSFHVKIDSSLKKGSLTIGQAFLEGKTQKEILVSCYICHPSMANDSLSGVVVATQLYKFLSKLKYRKYSYRFLFIPETIGAIVYLFHFGDKLKENLHAGLVLTCLGDPGQFNYKRTRHGNHELDQIACNVLMHSGKKFKVHNFWPLGSDERQFSSPGFKFPVGSLMRSIYGQFREYHTSSDNLEFVTEEALNESFEMYKNILYGLEENKTYKREQPFCEPMLSKYNLYNDLGASPITEKNKEAILWVLNFSDGEHSLVEIADRMNIDINILAPIAKKLEREKLIYAL